LNAENITGKVAPLVSELITNDENEFGSNIADFVGVVGDERKRKIHYTPSY